jgi:hypothetical protein
MPVSPDTQAAISDRYRALSTALLNDDAATERQILAPHFHDLAARRLDSYEYETMIVMVQSIARQGSALVVHALYYGPHGRSAAVDRWERLDGRWRLVDRH